MRSRRLTLLGTSLGFALLLTSCGYHTQTTSGSQYLERYGASAAGPAAAEPVAITDAEIVAAANVEPALTFPARIGLARIDQGQLSAIPEAEAAAWRKTAERLGPAYGQFVPISPLIAAMASPAKTESACKVQVEHLPGVSLQVSTPGFDCVRETVQVIRLGAARQHLDAVLIYESFGKSQDRSSPLAITKLALIGYFLPTENVEAEGLAQAILVDVRNGYHYGNATATAAEPAHRISMESNVDLSLIHI